MKDKSITLEGHDVCTNQGHWDVNDLNENLIISFINRHLWTSECKPRIPELAFSRIRRRQVISALIFIIISKQILWNTDRKVWNTSSWSFRRSVCRGWINGVCSRLLLRRHWSWCLFLGRILYTSWYHGIHYSWREGLVSITFLI